MPLNKETNQKEQYIKKLKYAYTHAQHTHTHTAQSAEAVEYTNCISAEMSWI